MLDFARIQRELDPPTSTPLFFRLRTAVINQIAEGSLQPGEALPSEQTFQDQLKINRSSVHAALHSLVGVGMVQSVPGVGNFVLERRPPAPSEKLAAIVVSEPSFHIYYPRMATAFNHSLHDAGYRVTLTVHYEDIGRFREICEELLARRVAAVALNASNREDVAPIIDDLKARGVAVILVGRRTHYSNADFVGVDNHLIGYQATRHLIQLEHTRIAYIGDAGLSTGRERAAGYIRALQEAGLTPRIFNGPYVRSQTHPAWHTDFVDLGGDPNIIWKAIARREITAAFCFNDGTAVWVMNETRKLKLSVPRDISLVSVDNLPFFQTLDVPLTTFGLPGEEVGLRAAELILRRLHGEELPPQRVLLPGRLIQRLSSAPPYRDSSDRAVS